MFSSPFRFCSRIKASCILNIYDRHLIPALGLSLKSVVLIPYLPWNQGAGSVVAGGAGGCHTDSSRRPRRWQCGTSLFSMLYPVFIYAIVIFNHYTTRFMLSCSCWLSNDACYIPWFYQLRVLYANCFVRNDEIKLWNQISKSGLMSQIVLINLGTL